MPRSRHSIKFLTRGELQRLLAQARQQSARDYCMILLAYRHGLRASEICGVQISHIDLDAGNIHCMRGKGSICNWQALARDEVKAIKAYMRERPKTDCPYLFISRNDRNIQNTMIYVQMSSAYVDRAFEAALANGAVV